MLHIGRVPATADDHDQALQQVAADLVAANFDVPLPEDVMPWKYRKLISNIGNVFQALVGRNGDWRPLVTDAEAEAAGCSMRPAFDTPARRKRPLRGRPASP